MHFSVSFVSSVNFVLSYPSADWLLHSDASLAIRIGAGVLIFAAMAWVDFRRNGCAATRWREYVFLLFAVAVALAYGVANDEVTARVSPEYFLYGKGLAPVVGGHPERLPWEAAKVGLKATWTVGLIAGVAVLLSNNPRPGRRRLPYRRLAARMPMILLCAAACAGLLGLVGYRGMLAPLSEDFREMVRRDEFRPFRFMAVYGVHLGGYVGGAIGIAAAVASIGRERRIP